MKRLILRFAAIHASNYSRVDLRSFVTLAASFLHFIGLSDTGECLVDFVSRVGVPF